MVDAFWQRPADLGNNCNILVSDNSNNNGFLDSEARLNGGLKFIVRLPGAILNPDSFSNKEMVINHEKRKWGFRGNIRCAPDYHGYKCFHRDICVLGFIWYIIKFAILPIEFLLYCIAPYFDDKVKAWAKNSKFKKLVDFYYDFFRGEY